MDEKNKAGVSAAITIGIAYLLCLVIALVWPATYIFGAGTLLHLSLGNIGVANITFGSSVIGFVLWLIIGWIFGYLFMAVYKKL